MNNSPYRNNYTKAIQLTSWRICCREGFKDRTKPDDEEDETLHRNPMSHRKYSPWRHLKQILQRFYRDFQHLFEKAKGQI